MVQVVSSFILDPNRAANETAARDDGPDGQIWSLVKLQAYVAYVKTFEPVLSYGAEQVWVRDGVGSCTCACAYVRACVCMCVCWC
jgi:hypothetical protein